VTYRKVVGDVTGNSLELAGFSEAVAAATPGERPKVGRPPGGLRFWWKPELDRAYTLARLVRASGNHSGAKAEAMLPPFIIDQIRRREEEESSKHELEQPRLELPQDVYPPPRERRPADERRDDETERGIVILEL
jgi:hypothetical protein